MLEQEARTAPQRQNGEPGLKRQQSLRYAGIRGQSGKEQTVRRIGLVRLLHVQNHGQGDLLPFHFCHRMKQTSLRLYPGFGP